MATAYWRLLLDVTLVGPGRARKDDGTCSNGRNTEVVIMLSNRVKMALLHGKLHTKHGSDSTRAMPPDMFNFDRKMLESTYPIDTVR